MRSLAPRSFVPILMASPIVDSRLGLARLVLVGPPDRIPERNDDAGDDNDPDHKIIEVHVLCSYVAAGKDAALPASLVWLVRSGLASASGRVIDNEVAAASVMTVAPSPGREERRARAFSASATPAAPVCRAPSSASEGLFLQASSL